MEFRLACPNGQWIAGKDRAIAAMKKLSPLGFDFELVQRQGVDFVRVANEVKIEINCIEGLAELGNSLDAPLIFYGRSLVISELET
jgi:hypothetical protein